MYSDMVGGLLLEARAMSLACFGAIGVSETCVRLQRFAAQGSTAAACRPYHRVSLKHTFLCAPDHSRGTAYASMTSSSESVYSLSTSSAAARQTST